MLHPQFIFNPVDLILLYWYGPWKDAKFTVYVPAIRLFQRYKTMNTNTVTASNGPTMKYHCTVVLAEKNTKRYLVTADQVNTKDPKQDKFVLFWSSYATQDCQKNSNSIEKDFRGCSCQVLYFSLLRSFSTVRVQSASWSSHTHKLCESTAFLPCSVKWQNKPYLVLVVQLVCSGWLDLPSSVRRVVPFIGLVDQRS